MTRPESLELSSRSSSPDEGHARLVEEESASQLSNAQAKSLYLSHTLSTWNARSYEFAAILFTAEAFPDTLLFSSIRGLSTTLTVLLLSSVVGQRIDRAKTRLSPLLASIAINRITIVVACIGWSFLLHGSDSASISSSHIRLSIFAAVVLLGNVERLSGVANMLAMERDWVPAVADEPGPDSRHPLTRVNSVMRRIDLVCKLIAPLVISGIAEITSMHFTVILLGFMSLFSFGLEYISAKHVWNTNSRLRAAKQISSNTTNARNEAQGDDTANSSPLRKCAKFLKQQYSQAQDYFSTDVWIPSLALSLLHFSPLSYSATFLTFLLNSGFSLLVVTVARAVGSVVEVSSTFVAPVGIKRLAHTKLDENDATTRLPFIPTEQPSENLGHEHTVGLARTGLWGLMMQCASLAPVVLAVWRIQPDSSQLAPDNDNKVALWAFTIIPLFFFLSISRLGLWVFDLTTQELTQVHVPSAQRSSFAGTEMAFVSLFELGQWLSAAVLSNPAQFRWLALAGFTAVTASAVMYAFWVRIHRGHLVHWELVGKTCTCRGACRK